MTYHNSSHLCDDLVPTTTSPPSTSSPDHPDYLLAPPLVLRDAGIHDHVTLISTRTHQHHHINVGLGTSPGHQRVLTGIPMGILVGHMTHGEVRGFCYGVWWEAASRSGTSQNPQNTNTKSNTNPKHKSHVLIV